MKEIWYGVGVGFGDMWASVHWCLRRSEAKREKVYLSKWTGSAHDHDERSRLSDMLSIIDAPDSQVEIVDDQPNACIYGECWAARYYPTLTKWKESECVSNVLAYQFDGKSAAAEKNLSVIENDNFLSWARMRGYSLVRIGLPLSNAECVRALCTARAFVGVCSGMSTLAISTGIPVFIIEYGVKGAWWYGPNPVYLCDRVKGFTDEFDARMRPWDKDEAAKLKLFVGRWRSSSGYCVQFKESGEAAWSEHGQTVVGSWKKLTDTEYVLATWINGWTYRFNLTGVDSMQCEERHPDGRIGGSSHARRLDA